MFSHELRLEAAVTVTWDVEGQGAEIALERLGAAALRVLPRSLATVPCVS